MFGVFILAFSFWKPQNIVMFWNAFKPSCESCTKWEPWEIFKHVSQLYELIRL